MIPLCNNEKGVAASCTLARTLHTNRGYIKIWVSWSTDIPKHLIHEKRSNISRGALRVASTIREVWSRILLLANRPR